jgi:hypothetical protein
MYSTGTLQPIMPVHNMCRVVAGWNCGSQVPRTTKNVLTMDGNKQYVSNFDGEAGTRFLNSANEVYEKTAKEIYDELVEFNSEFKNSDSLFNKPAPEPWVALMIGGVSSYFYYILIILDLLLSLLVVQTIICSSRTSFDIIADPFGGWRSAVGHASQ